MCYGGESGENVPHHQAVVRHQQGDLQLNSVTIQKLQRQKSEIKGFIEPLPMLARKRTESWGRKFQLPQQQGHLTENNLSARLKKQGTFIRSLKESKLFTFTLTTDKEDRLT